VCYNDGTSSTYLNKNWYFWGMRNVFITVTLLFCASCCKQKQTKNIKICYKSN
jgi:hypothetical protein